MANFNFLDCEKDPKRSDTEILSEKFLKTRQIILNGQVSEELSEKIARQLLILEADSEKPIYIFIDSPGGAVDSGFAIFDMIRFVAAPVFTVGMGLVASAAALILLSAPKERRIALPNSHFLIHQPLIGGKGIQGVATDIEIEAHEMAKTRAKINEIIAKESGKSLETVTADTERDYWLTADEAKNYGLVSKIIRSRAELKEISQ